MDKTRIDREVSPILASFLATDQGRNDCVFQLFCWLKKPLRTSEEVTYVIGNLADNVYDIMQEHFSNYLNQGRFWNTLCGTVANTIRYREDLWGFNHLETYMYFIIKYLPMTIPSHYMVIQGTYSIVSYLVQVISC